MNKTIINISTYIKNIVNEKGKNMVLDLDGIVLDTCDEMHIDNLTIYELSTFVKQDRLCANTNWGMIDLEIAITDIDDWYTLEDIVTDLR